MQQKAYIRKIYRNNLLNLKSFITFHVLLNIHNNLTIPVINTKTIITRSKTNNNLNHLQNRTNYGRFRIQAIGNILFNKLPINIKTIRTHSIFKRELKNWIIQNPAYSIYNFL